MHLSTAKECSETKTIIVGDNQIPMCITEQSYTMYLRLAITQVGRANTLGMCMCERSSSLYYH